MSSALAPHRTGVHTPRILLRLDCGSPFRQECGMQVDGVEEEIPGELENICSDDGEL